MKLGEGIAAGVGIVTLAGAMLFIGDWKGKAEVSHGDTAEMKDEIPPVIEQLAVGQRKLQQQSVKQQEIIERYDRALKANAREDIARDRRSLQRCQDAPPHDALGRAYCEALVRQYSGDLEPSEEEE